MKTKFINNHLRHAAVIQLSDRHGVVGQWVRWSCGWMCTVTRIGKLWCDEDRFQHGPINELLKLCDAFARALADAETNPADCAQWITHVLQALETEAYERASDQDHPALSNLMLERVQDAISDRLIAGRWEP